MTTLLPQEASLLWAKGFFSGPLWFYAWTAECLNELTRTGLRKHDFSEAARSLTDSGFSANLVEDMGLFFSERLVPEYLHTATTVSDEDV